MNSLGKSWAFRVVLFLLVVVLFPVAAASVALAFGSLNGAEFPGSLLMILIANSNGPASIIQQLVIPLLGVVGVPMLWRERGRYAVMLIAICVIGLCLTYAVWAHLSDPAGAADLWQEARSPLNGETFPAAMHAYMKPVMIGWSLVLVGVFGVKGAERFGS